MATAFGIFILIYLFISTLQLVKLDSLALYWNSNDDIGKLPSQEKWKVITLRLTSTYITCRFLS